MPFEPWMFAAMEEEGFMDTTEGQINRVAKYLSDSPNSVVDINQFRNACYVCNVDPDSFRQSDLDRLVEVLNSK